MEKDMEEKCTLLDHLNQLHTTELGVSRIRRNLELADIDVVDWCRKVIQSTTAQIEQRGKNWYIYGDGCVLTVHRYSYTIITAHKASHA